MFAELSLCMEIVASILRFTFVEHGFVTIMVFYCAWFILHIAGQYCALYKLDKRHRNYEPYLWQWIQMTLSCIEAPLRMVNWIPFWRGALQLCIMFIITVSPLLFNWYVLQFRSLWLPCLLLCTFLALFCMQSIAKMHKMQFDWKLQSMVEKTSDHVMELPKFSHLFSK